MSQGIDPREFRVAAGQFMTGVTVITTLDGDGGPSGLTANSFSSVSLHPPMVLFGLGRDSTNFEAFQRGNGFVVHVLSAAAQDMAVRFAAKGIDRFEGIAWKPGHRGLPVIAGALAVFQCDNAGTYDGGDHVIHLGEVKEMRVGDTSQDGLGYFRGRYIASPGHE